MQYGLTEKQLECLKFIKAYQKDKGVSPSIENIKIGMGQKSKSQAHRLVVELEQRGFLFRLHGHNRSIKVIEDDNNEDASRADYKGKRLVSKGTGKPGRKPKEIH